MKVIVLLLVVLGFIAYAHAGCETMCTNGLEDGNNLFIGGQVYGTWGLPYVRDKDSIPIQKPHDKSITTAVIVIHGNQRDANNYFCYINQAVISAGMSATTYVIAPHFMLFNDTPSAISPNAFYWENSASWKEGGRSNKDTTRISSFQILDDIVKAFYNKDFFPGMKEVIVVGHSAGGQTVQRYAFSTGIDANYTVRHVVENPGSYAYLDDYRAMLPNVTRPTCNACNATEILSTQYTFGLISRGKEQTCTGFSDWKMGVENGNVYTKLRTNAVIRAQYQTKNIHYILGTNDTCNTDLGPNCGCTDNSLDTDCTANMQGNCRLQRGVIFYQYLQQYYKADRSSPVHKLSFVSDLGHDGCAMLNSYESLKAMFPNAIISTPGPTADPSAPSSSPSATPSSTPTTPTTTPTPSPPSPTSAPTIVNATITISAIVAINDISAVKYDQLEKAFASTIGVPAEYVKVTLTPITQKKRATDYRMTVTITQPVAAGSSDTVVSANAASAIKAAIADNGSTLGQALATSGATVNATSVTAQTVVPNSPVSGTTSDSGASSILVSLVSVVVSVSLVFLL